MNGFDGFPLYPEDTLTMPDAFFVKLLPSVRSILELKVTLHLMWTLSHRVGKPRCVEYLDLLSDRDLLESLKVEDGPRPAEDYLREGLELALARGSVLQVQLIRDGRRQVWYFLNTPHSREAVGRLQEGHLPEGTKVMGQEPIEEVRVYRPNVFALYEQNIGSLTPLIADRLRVAESQYPATWLEEAIKMSVEYNRRSWRYVEAILQRWEVEGKDHGTNRRSAEEDTDPYGYFRSKYQHLYR